MKKEGTASGHISLVDGVIYYRSSDYGTWSLPLRDIVLVGEYTNDHGPYLDDWFMVFMKKEREWGEASVYADGRDEFRMALSKALGAEIQPALTSHTDFWSRIIWPPELKDQSLFDFRKARGSRVLRKLKLAVIPEVQFCLSEATEKYLEKISNSAVH